MKKVFLAAAIGLAMLAGCTKDKDRIDGSDAAGIETIGTITTITASAPAGSSAKIATAGEQMNEVQWVRGDMIYVAEVQEDGATFNAAFGLSAFEATSISEDGKSATFEMIDGEKPLVEGNTYVACHSGFLSNSMTEMEGNRIKHAFETTFRQYGAGNFAAADGELFFISAPAVTSERGATFAFQHLMSLLEFEIWTNDESAFSGFLIDRVTVEAPAMTVNPPFVETLTFDGAGELTAADAAGTLSAFLTNKKLQYPLNATHLKVRIPVMWNPEATPDGDFVITLHPASETGTPFVINKTAQELLPGRIYQVSLQAIAALAAPAILTHPDNASVADGESASFSVTASGNPAPRYQWQYSTDYGATWTNVPAPLKGIPSPYSGQTSATLTLLVARTSYDGYQYRCVATNSQGNAISNAATLTLALPPAVTPANPTVVAGGTVSLSVDEQSRLSRYQWNIVTGSGSRLIYTPITDGGIYSGATTSTLTLTGVSQDYDGYRFCCVISSIKIGSSVTSQVVTLTVTELLIAPSFTLQPAASQTVNQGSAVTFTAAASGTPAPTYQWQYRSSSSGSWSDISLATNPTLSIASAQGADAGQYRCKATNSAGTANSTVATLTVNVPVSGAPVITQHPADVFVMSSGSTSVTFTVVATGDPTLEYQWQRRTKNLLGEDYGSWTTLGGATSASYSVSLTSTAVGNQYRCLVINTKGTVESNPANVIGKGKF